VSTSLFLLPKFAESLTEARVVSWLAAEGTTLKPGQPLVAIETDKTTLDVEVWSSCVVEQHLVAAGTLVPVGTPLARLRALDTKAPAAAAPISAPVAQPPAPASPTQEERVVDLSRIHAHRARWQGRGPHLTSYLALSVARALSATQARDRVAAMAFIGGEAEPWRHMELDSALQLLRIEALMRQPSSGKAPSAPAVLLACEPLPPSAPDAVLRIMLEPAQGRLTITGTEREANAIADAVARQLSEFSPSGTPA
jgi:pyruvate/2-oxoglutarate dehydrogenase complex dihydrolipoamide acyltransferase (E2) component